jgi:Transposase DDE domain/Domain of unknown function (DUF4372)
MAKSTFFTGQPVLNQLLSLIPRTLVNDLSRKHKSDRYCKRFKSNDHLVSMLFSTFNRCGSLRELITGLQANSYRLNHLGLFNTPRRSTLADANKRRSSVFFEDLFHKLYRLHYGVLPDSRKNNTLPEKLFIVDSTTITLFSQVLKGAGVVGSNGKKKGGLKAHVLFNAKDQTPCFVHLTASSKSDRTMMPMLRLPAGSVIVMDKAYVNYKVMSDWSAKKITWVTRLNTALRWEIVRRIPLTDYHKQQGVRSDDLIMLGNPQTQQRNPLQLARLVTFYDQKSEREFTFLTNNTDYSPVTIANIYKKRWAIELLFKRVKQNFQLYNFLGDNENAIKIQLWCTLIADLLIKVVKDRVEKINKRKWSFANIAGLIRQHLTTYIDLIRFLLNPDNAILDCAPEQINNQILLFKT